MCMYCMLCAHEHDGVCAPVCAVILCMKSVVDSQSTAVPLLGTYKYYFLCVYVHARYCMLGNSTNVTHGTLTQAVYH